MAAEFVYALKSATKGGAAVDGVRFAKIVPRTQFSVHRGHAEAQFDADAIVTYRELAVELHGTKDLTLMTLLGSAAGDVVLTVLGAAGASETLTIQDVDFCEVAGQMQANEKDAGGQAGLIGIRGYARFAADNDFSDILAAA
ncbi:MAG: hypothetical protein WC789_13785 [Lentisphaeria bacterium]